MTSSRIVLVLPDAPLPFGGAAARWFYSLLRGLVDRGHRVTALVVAESADADRSRELFPPDRYDVRYHRPPVRNGIFKKLESLVYPYSYIYSREFVGEIEELTRSRDSALHLEQLWSGWTGLGRVDRALLNIHYLYDIDLADERPNSFEGRLRRAMTFRGERALLRRYPVITTLSDRLSQRTREINKSAQVTTVPLGFDSSLYPFDPARRRGERPVVGLIGSFGWGPSYTAAKRLIERLWPEIRKRRPDARLMIVGRKAKRALAELTEGLEVELVEDVPDIMPYWNKLDVLLYAPGRGSGMKVKVIEAMALGVDVVTTWEGVEGLEAIDRVHAGIADDDSGLIDRTIEILAAAESNRIDRRTAARSLVETTCDPTRSIEKLECIYEKILSKNHNSRFNE